MDNEQSAGIRYADLSFRDGKGEYRQKLNDIKKLDSRKHVTYSLILKELIDKAHKEICDVEVHQS